MREEIIGSARLILGDCREVLPGLSVEACVTDPPYGIARVWKGGFGRGWGKADSQKALRNSWDELPPDADVLEWIAGCKRSIVWGGNYFGLPPSRGWLVWNKPERGFTLAEAELAWTNIDTVVRVIDAPRSESDREHPTQKPVKVMSFSVEKTRGTVCDPFMGSGTTGVSCVRLARPFVGIEINEGYFEIALRRIEAAQRQSDLFVSAPKPPAPITGDMFA